jgi:hypothetical protein
MQLHRRLVPNRRRVVALASATLMGCSFVFTASSIPRQQTPHLPRLALNFRCPNYVLPGAAPLSLEADVFGTQDSESVKGLTFNWQLSAAKIISGQGSRKIAIESATLPVNRISTISAVVTVEGGPPEMISRQSCILRVNPSCSEPQLVDSYSVVTLHEERQHLNRLAKLLMKAAPIRFFI